MDMEWKEAARRAVHWSLPVGLTGLSLGWTVYAVGEILAHQAPAPLAYTVAGIYDAVWLYALAMETAHRRQGSSGKLPASLGWLFLVTSVGVLVTHGLLYATAIVAVIGAVVPAAAKATLIMAVERDTTRISPSAQQQIDAVRSATRDQVAIGRAVTRAKADRHKTAAHLEREEHAARGRAHKVRHAAAEKLAELASEHPAADLPEGVPALFSDEDLAQVLGQWTQEGVSPVSPQVSPVSPIGEIAAAKGEGHTPLDWPGLAHVAAVVGVETPRPGEPLTEEQLMVVLRWLRHSENPPLSYRKALAAYRAAGFSAKEERVRKAYAALIDAEDAQP
ncbi:hypothetical protein OG870_27805 [Streptomyces sp. NBC_00461]|uniref:hypothetical protein n=1 Tax=Streptomyces sp. NBC_00461 TaxID=2975750 RepID=UPI002E184989